ncbi:MAG TPA: hypothetical protein PK988_08265, partial [Candidatus Sumerlaeota bacterium]|nr:hypothetical protein [Candidatus Sumerlaeota bacterium]
YQSLFDVTALPNASHVLVSMQRSSTIVVHDPFTGHPREQFQLADRGGNPVLTVVGNELWTIDYDTFVAVDLSSRQATTKLLLQAGLNNGSQFAGKLFYWKPYHKAVIPRPFSGDVVILDEKHTAIESGVKLGREPLECVVTREGRIVARDWKTGHWLEGNISK